MIKKISLIVNTNQYDSKRYFSEHFAQAWRRRGTEVDLIDMQSITADHLKRFITFSPTLTCSFNSFLPNQENKYLWDYLKIPHLYIAVDPMIFQLHFTKNPYIIISCVDQYDCKLLKEKADFHRTFFLPHAIEKDLTVSLNEDKPLDVTFLGTCYDYENIKKIWEEKCDSSISKAIEGAVEIVFSQTGIYFVDALLQTFDSYQIPLDLNNFMPACFYLDYYLRGYDRVMLIRSIKHADVHVFGDICLEGNLGNQPWSHYLSSQKNVTIHPGVPFKESMELVKKSKICINSFPIFQNGSHERLMTGLASKSIVITNEGQFVKDNFTQDEGVITYLYRHRESVNDQIDLLLSNQTLRKSRGANGCIKVKENHTWDNRVEFLEKQLPPLIKQIYLDAF